MNTYVVFVGNHVLKCRADFFGMNIASQVAQLLSWVVPWCIMAA